MTALVIILICIVTILVVMGFWALSLHNRLQGWCSPENYERAIDLERKRLDDTYSVFLANWKRDEIEGIRTQEREVAEAQAINKLVEWQADMEPLIREDAIKRSQAVSKGKITEHLVPFFPAFTDRGYNSRDARFLGSPVDIILFNGLSDGELKEIVFLEIKTGKSALTARERQIRNCVDTRSVRWEELRV